MEFRKINDEGSFEAFRSLLRNAGLPADDLNFQKDLLLGYYENGVLSGTIALEVYGAHALLRSLSVMMGLQGKSIGTSLVSHIIAHAKKTGLTSLYLLTETAGGFFKKIGFETITRGQVPFEITKSSEFSHVCPVSATVMMLKLERV